MSDLTQAWNDAQSQLPAGWSLDGLRCASASLRPEDRSEEWIAVGVSDSGERREHRAADPTAALEGLVEGFRAP